MIELDDYDIYLLSQPDPDEERRINEEIRDKMFDEYFDEYFDETEINDR